MGGRRIRRGRGGFTAMEILVLLGIVAVLLSIFIPYLTTVREMDRRTRCASNLRRIQEALYRYAQLNNYCYPQVVQDPRRPDGYTAFTGADASDPFAADSQVRPNDVTASLWLLVREGLITADYQPPSAVFICPSAGDEVDAMRNAAGAVVSPKQRGNFRSGRNLSYSYCSPFTSASGFRLKDDLLRPRFVLMADKNPGVRLTGSNVAGPSFNAPPLEMAQANSRNHGGAGQNVLYADGHVSFESTPYCGCDEDNIYTAQAAEPLSDATTPQPHSNGVCGRQHGPARAADTYLVPTADETEAPPLAEVTTRPVAPATTQSPSTATAPAEPQPKPATTQSSSASQPAR